MTPSRNRQPLLILLLAGVMMLGMVVWSWPATRWQGVNYHVQQQHMPLGLKLVAFLHRDAEYRHLVSTLVPSRADRDATILQLFEWTRAHIRPVPEGFPIVDDHVWDIIVRGYGTQDQAADVFATLCAYAGIPAQLQFLRISGRAAAFGVALVQCSHGWGVFEPQHHIIIRSADGSVASLAQVHADPTLIARCVPNQMFAGYPLARYFETLPSGLDAGFSKPDQQMPWRRLRMVPSRWGGNVR